MKKLIFLMTLAVVSSTLRPMEKPLDDEDTAKMLRLEREIEALERIFASLRDPLSPLRVDHPLSPASKTIVEDRTGYDEDIGGEYTVWKYDDGTYGGSYRVEPRAPFSYFFSEHAEERFNMLPPGTPYTRKM